MGLMRRRRPVRTGAMIAAGGAAYHAMKKRKAEQAGGYGQSAPAQQTAYQQQQPYQQAPYQQSQPYQQASYPQAPPPAQAPQGMAAQLEQLKQLRDQGVLTNQEFEEAKAKVLQGG